jgi:hypothetical protein
MLPLVIRYVKRKAAWAASIIARVRFPLADDDKTAHTATTKAELPAAVALQTTLLKMACELSERSRKTTNAEVSR